LLYSWSAERSRWDVMAGGKDGLEAMLQGLGAGAVRREGRARGTLNTRGGVLLVSLGEDSSVWRHERVRSNRNNGGLPDLLTPCSVYQ
jgi:hypothetical protein